MSIRDIPSKAAEVPPLRLSRSGLLVIFLLGALIGVMVAAMAAVALSRLTVEIE